MNYAIRPIINDDLDKILEIDNVIFTGKDAWSKSTLSSYCDPKYSFLAYNENTGEIYGYISLRKINENHFHFGNLAVVKQYQQQGIAKHLANTALDYARNEFNENQNVIFTLDVKKDNPAKKGYLKYGFQISSGYGEYDKMYWETKGLQKEVILTSTRIQEPIENDLNGQKSQLQSIEEIVNILIFNIENKRNGRLSSGSDSDKVTQFKELKSKLEESDNAQNPEEIINNIHQLCKIKRNPFHFWSTPHSVKEFSQLLKSHHIQPKQF